MVYLLTGMPIKKKKKKNEGPIHGDILFQSYHPPSSKDIPTDFRVEFLADAPNPKGVLGSKSKWRLYTGRYISLQVLHW